MTFKRVSRLLKAPNQSFFLFGPRGTGKTTLLKKRFPNTLLIQLLLPNIRRKFTSDPEYLLEVVQAQPAESTIIIDEIQRVPELLSLVHLLIEEKQGWKFILTGSSARKLKQKGVDLLGGRAIKKMLHPFMAVELGELFNLEEALQFGLIPLRFESDSPAEVLETYVSLYLEEEVQAEGIVRRIEPFARFLEIVSFSHGSTLNVSNIARECGVKRTTASSWISILEDLLLSYQIPVFTRRAKRQLTSHTKFYLFDAGVFQALRPRSVMDQVTEIHEAALEGLVAQHLRAWVDYTEEKHQLFFWRTKSGVEVDFILFGPLGFWAIEVKNSQHINPGDLRSLSNFCEDYPEAKPILLYRGKEKLLKKEILCIPINEFLLRLMPNQAF